MIHLKHLPSNLLFGASLGFFISAGLWPLRDCGRCTVRFT
jgi:hypothetical protein